MMDRASDSRHSSGADNDFSRDSSAVSAPMLKAVGFAAKHSFSNLKRFEFERAPAKTDEVELEILFCGVCHSDIHQVKNEWSNTIYPCLPGHEIVGRITRAGSAVTQHHVGDLVGVGCSAVWHLYPVLQWLSDHANYSVPQALFDVAHIAMQINLANESKQLERGVQREIFELVEC